jgi:signal transduction histidine kinase
MQRGFIRRVSYSFYDNTIEKYANQSITSVTLKDLLLIAANREQALINSAQFLHHELPIRLAQRVKDIQTLPFIVGSNPQIRKLHDLYATSFESIRAQQPIATNADAQLFASLLRSLVEDHKEVIKLLALGINECKNYMPKNEATEFLDRMITARIGIRVLAEHFLALGSQQSSSVFGIVNTQVKPEIIIRKCLTFAQELCEMNYNVKVPFVITGQVDTEFPYIVSHFDYMMFELLKNSLRATAEYSQNYNDLHPVEVTISKGSDNVTLRIRDRGGGIPYEKLENVFEYSYSTVDTERDDVFLNQTKRDFNNQVGGAIAGLGFGLPVTRLYSEFFGGSLHVMSLHGYGCDVFLRLNNIIQVKNMEI